MRQLFEQRRQELALVESLAELRMGFPRLRRIPSFLAWRFFEVADTLTEEDRGDLVRGLVGLCVHPSVKSQYPVNRRQEELAKRVRESTYTSRKDVWDTAGKGARTIRTQLHKEIRRLMRTAMPEAETTHESRSILSYRVLEGRWRVFHHFDFGKPIAHMSAKADVVWPEFASPFALGFSLMPCLGLYSATEWTHVDEQGVGEAAELAVEMAVHYGAALKVLLRDLPGPTVADQNWHPEK